MKIERSRLPARANFRSSLSTRRRLARRPVGEGGFLNLRALIGLFIVIAGVFLALAGFGAFSTLAQAQQKHKIITNSTNPLVPNGFDCSKIKELGIDRQANLRAGAIMIACGLAPAGPLHPATSPIGAICQFMKKLLAPLAYGGTDVDLITGTETYPKITQSETFSTANPDNPDQIVVAYNDARGATANPPNFSGASVSTDGGNTFTRLSKANGQGPFDNTAGDPVVIYNRPTGTWYTVWLDLGCGSGALGGYKSTTPWDPTSWTHYCIHNGSMDDRESGWADNNPYSPFYGRMYVSWVDFARGIDMFVRYSTDNGLTWTNERQLTTMPIRNVQITGDLATGDVYIAGMDEMDARLGNRANKIYRSTDGGNTWTNTYTGPTFPGPGRVVCPDGYFACMYPDHGGYWRYMGWGEPAALGGVVHYVYAARNTGNGDPGDIFYIRSSDKGQTFSAPFKLNTDTTTRAQWEPNLSVSPGGTLLAVWYDERETTSCQEGNPSVPCYRMWARRSNDNGVTWLPDDMFSDVVSPLHESDPNVLNSYAGDYDYASAVATKHLSSWVDGRVIINGISQQDAFTDRELVGFAVTLTDPACGSIIMNQPTEFVVNVNYPVDPTTVQASDFTANGIPASSVTVSNNNTTITFTFTTTPVVNQGLQTMHIPAGAFDRASDGQPVLEFTCTFRYDVLLLHVTSTNPPVGGTLTGPGDSLYDVNFNEPVDPASVQASDLTLSDVPGTVTNVNVINGNMTAEFTLHFIGILSGSLTASIPAGAITDQYGNPGAAFSGNYDYVAEGFCDSRIIQNSGFETGDFTGWVIDSSSPMPVVTNTASHSGTFSAVAGGATGANQFCGHGSEPSGDSSFYQQFAVPASGGTLSFWHQDCTTDSIAFDWQDAYITDSNGNILQTIFHLCDAGDWTNKQVDMTPYAGQTVRVKFLVHQDGAGDLTGMYVDDVALYVPCASPTPTPTPRPSPTPRPRPTPAPRP